MKRKIEKTVVITTVLTLILQMLIPLVPGLNIEVLAVDETIADLEISTKEELIAFANDVNNGNTYKGKTVVLVDDIDLEGNENEQWIPIGIGDTFYDGFAGIFDGQSHKISGMYLNNKQLESQGLFATNSGTIKNLQIVNSTIKDGIYYTGLIVGKNRGGIIDNCSTSGCSIIISTGYYSESTGRTDIYAGGIVGSNGGSISNCKNSATITCNNDVSDINDSIFIGGIAGKQGAGSEILNCSNTANIISDGAVGGIIGSARNSASDWKNSIINCYNLGNISSKQGEKQSYIGGICGKDASYIKNCYNSGNIKAQGSTISGTVAGGIVARGGDTQPIVMCYNTGKVESTKGNAGGIVGGWCNHKDIIACFNTGEIKANMYGGGIKDANAGTIENCYNVGKVSLNSTSSGPSVGAIVNSNTGLSGTTKVNGTISNCYYKNDSCSKGIGNSEELGNGTPISKTETEMKKIDFIEQLNNGGDYYTQDTKNINNGYPVLKWMVDETAPTVKVEYSTKGPTQGNVTVTITSNEEVQTVQGWTLSSDKKTLTKEYSTNENETITIKDFMGNETQATIEINNIDKTAPTVNIGYSTQNPTKGNVKVTITSNEEVQSVTGWTLSNDKKTLTKEYSANTKETITVKDLAGNTKETTIQITNIDKTAPTVNVGYSTQNPTKGNVKVTITSNEEVQSVTGWTLSSDKRTLTKEYSANTKETITVKDLAGNEKQATIEINNIDKTGPSVNIEYSTKNPTRENVIVTIKSNEEMQSVTGWTLSSDKKTLTKEYSANTKETVIIKDLVGNETQATIEISNIDKTGLSVNVGYSTKNPTRENVIVTITSNKEVEAVQGWTLSSDKKTLTKEYSANTKETITIKDLAGNETQANIEINNIDKTGPSVNVGYSTKNPTRENVTVTITSNEEIQGVTGWTLSSDKKTLTKEYSANTKETITVKDLAGNEKQATIEINNIDKTAPTVNVGYSTKNPTKENVTVTITSNEEIQGVTGWTLSSDKKTLTKEYTENTKETITIKDLAGNETQANIEISNIDKNLPETTIGDINQDGKIDVTDLLMLKRHLVAGNRSEWKLTGDSLVSADMNENGTIDITDMLMLKRKIVENI